MITRSSKTRMRPGDPCKRPQRLRAPRDIIDRKGTALRDKMLLVLLLRHAESTSNVGDDVEDPTLTATGVAQADAWRERTASWSLDAILVSPMLRCIATAARALGACNCSRWEVCAAAREHWWVHKQNRGRLAADLLPDLVDLPSHGLTNATIVAAVGAPSEHWDPVDEAEGEQALARTAKRRGDPH